MKFRLTEELNQFTGNPKFCVYVAGTGVLSDTWLYEFTAATEAEARAYIERKRNPVMREIEIIEHPSP